MSDFLKQLMELDLDTYVTVHTKTGLKFSGGIAEAGEDEVVLLTTRPSGFIHAPNWVHIALDQVASWYELRDERGNPQVYSLENITTGGRRSMQARVFPR